MKDIRFATLSIQSLNIKNWLIRKGLTVVIILFLVGCSSLDLLGTNVIDIPKKNLELPVGVYGAIVRFSDDTVLIAEDKIENEILRFYDLQENRFVEVSIPTDERCRKTDYVLPTALPNGRLGLTMICHGRWPDKVIGRDGANYLLGYNWEQNTLEPIIDMPLSRSESGFSWNPEMTRAVQSVGSLQGTIQWLTPQGTKPITLTLGEGQKSWRLDENFAAMADSDRIDVGIARSPVWSPDGRWIAFLASSDAIGREGFARARATYKMYLLDPDTLQHQIILTGITNTRSVQSLTWSPDSQWLVIAGRIGNKDGLWLSSISGETLQFIDGKDDSTFDGAGWLDHQTIIATRCVNLEEPCLQSDVITYDVSQVIQTIK